MPKGEDERCSNSARMALHGNTINLGVMAELRTGLVLDDHTVVKLKQSALEDTFLQKFVLTISHTFVEKTFLTAE